MVSPLPHLPSFSFLNAFPSQLQALNLPSLLLVAILLLLSASYIIPWLHRSSPRPDPSLTSTQPAKAKPSTAQPIPTVVVSPITTPTTGNTAMAAPNPSGMSAPAANLPPPGNKQFRLSDLKAYDGTAAGKPIYVSIKGTVFDVSSRADSYGPSGSYHIFAGKDASKGLGSSSLKPEDAVYDWSGLNDKDKKVLGDWYGFFQKRYPIVGYVADIPANLRA